MLQKRAVRVKIPTTLTIRKMMTDFSRNRTESQITAKRNICQSQRVIQKNAQKPSIKIAFLGGLNEIGKNITLVECENDIIIIDCGMAFPDGDMLGVDLVIRISHILNRMPTELRVLSLHTDMRTISAVCLFFFQR